MLYELHRSDVAVSPGRWEELPTAGRRGRDFAEEGIEVLAEEDVI